ncbi:MAG TPA: hypothetical protein VF467_17515, partial [Afipia sp.]
EARLHALPGHPRLSVEALKQGVDARVKPGHDESRDLRRMIREYAQDHATALLCEGRVPDAAQRPLRCSAEPGPL